MFKILKTTVTAVKEALSFRIKEYEEAINSGDYDLPHLTRSGRLLLAASTLYPTTLRRWITVASSHNLGSSILDQVFPRYDNPQDYHSSELVVDLSDRPVQVLGWADVDRLKQQGIVDSNLDRDWVDIGFAERAEQRGIDLESHFHRTPPLRSSPEQPTSRLYLPQS